ncbi:polyunsaturated fatty acid lipoxygenase ALOX8-like [Dreissena polymorpha]|uniref:Lipoxygenase domain-containing protein n=1 Tax=Dreissena polymorpha TaxID=45954 RepID=A0A9D4MMX0_DREPO|nr:polyunsaturated fatty acid lipoxygenase ALOX8-like [Dreissena polymorpha]KAH3880567.1 hypothetical protein DPMN_004484 [Dreissena polymorpha]
MSLTGHEDDVHFKATFEQVEGSRSKGVITLTIDTPNWEKVNGIELWKHKEGDKITWTVEKVTMDETLAVEQSLLGVYPITPTKQEVYSSIAWCAKHDGCTSLPQCDPDQEKRKRKLLRTRKLYEYTQRSPGIPCQVRKVPDNHTLHYLSAAIQQKLLEHNSAIWNKHCRPWKTAKDVAHIYGCVFQQPSDITRWEDDVKFGLQRFAGTNNTMIRLCTELPEKLQVTPKMLKPFLGKYTLDKALKKRRLFVVDHAILERCPTVLNTTVCSPIALFYRDKRDRIVPIAIQLFQEKAEDNPVFLPSDDKYTWIIAKMWFNNADACVHQAITHLGYTHIVMEGFEVAVYRNLSKSHPMFKLMAPHFMYLMTINNLALDLLLGPGKYFDTVVSVGTKGAYELIKRYRTKWRLNVDGTLPADLKERGVDSPEIVPNYPFRDDALLTYNAILQYVTDYVHLYYPSDDMLNGDYEIQCWRAELDRPIEQGGLGIMGVEGVDGRFTSRDQLIQVVTSIIYTCSVGHAAANFKQYDEYAFPMNYPSLLRGRPPSDKKRRTESDVIEIIQDRANHYQLMTITKILSDHSYGNPLGDFDENFITDPKALNLVKEFRAKLDEVSETINESNEIRETRYDYLEPSKISNSINI